MGKCQDSLENLMRNHTILFLDKRNEDGSIYKELEFEQEFTTIREELEYADKMHNLEEQLSCPLEVMVAVFKAVQQGFIFVDLGYGLYRKNSISLDYGDISEDEEGYIGCSKSTNYHYILDYDGCVFVEDYKKTWWLKETKEE